MIRGRYKEQGATALIVVIFSVLLLVTVSLGFMRLVVHDQQRTTDDELSRGAYDSSIAGVEDGKRVLQACIANGDAAACSALANGECNTVHTAKILSPSDDSTNQSEVLLQNSTGTSGGFDQAYTCVKIDRETDDFTGALSADTSQVIPLRTTGSFTDIIVSWFLKPDPSVTVDLNADGTLPASTMWSPVGEVRPPILRVQLMQYRQGSFSLSDFDEDGGGHTVYLYPSTVGASDTLPVSFGSDLRRTASTDGLLKAVRCDASALASSTYVCSARLTLPLPVGATTPSERAAYLRVTSIYGNTDFRIQADGTKFLDVEPAIDSTGRAADVFRRVRARVQLVSPVDTQLYPRATVDITKNFCKNFAVSSTQYYAGSCLYSQP